MKRDESGQLSLDFLIGFTIFLVGFIIVITMASGLLVSLMSKTVDYDAVAYRTGVILVEDPGWAFDPLLPPGQNTTTRWELINPVEKQDVLRAGLALSKNYPAIITEAKIEEFFTLSPSEIHQEVLFDSPVSQGGISQYSYRYNIKLSEVGGGSPPKELGDPVPTNKDTGYIKRMVKIKPSSSAIIDVSEDRYDPPLYQGAGEFIVYMDIYHLYQRDPLHRIDPLTEDITITLTNINARGGLPSNCNEIALYNDFGALLPDSSTDTKLEILVRNVHYFLNDAENTITLHIEPGFFYERDIKPQDRYYFKFFFEPDTVHLGGVEPYEYNYGYDTPGPSQPPLVPAVLEVRTW